MYKMVHLHSMERCFGGLRDLLLSTENVPKKVPENDFKNRDGNPGSPVTFLSFTAGFEKLTEGLVYTT